MRRSKLTLWALCLVALGFVFAPQAFASGKWEPTGTSDGVRLSKMEVEGSSIVAFRGEVVADVNIAKLIAVFIDSNERRHWVDRYAGHKTLERSETREVYWIKFALPFPATDRDYVLQTDVAVDEDTKVFTARIKSVVDRRKGEDGCCVRAEVRNTFYRFQALPDGRTSMSVEVHTDPKGRIPTWLVNRIQRDWPSKTLSGLINRTKKSPVPAHPHFVDWH
ncbi:MAG: START domain-containing protein [Bradymonadaceae bacterium]